MGGVYTVLQGERLHRPKKKTHNHTKSAWEAKRVFDDSSLAHSPTHIISPSVSCSHCVFTRHCAFKTGLTRNGWTAVDVVSVWQLWHHATEKTGYCVSRLLLLRHVTGFPRSLRFNAAVGSCEEWASWSWEGRQWHHSTNWKRQWCYSPVRKASWGCDIEFLQRDIT